MLLVRFVKPYLKVDFSGDIIFVWVPCLQSVPSLQSRAIFAHAGRYPDVAKERFLVGSIVDVDIDVRLVAQYITIERSAVSKSQAEKVAYNMASWSHLGSVTCLPTLKFF